MKNQRSPLIIIFLTIFIDLAGFGILIPLTPSLAKHFDASPSQIGFLLSIYSLMQFIFSPIWGRWSDRIGRRPIILFTLLGSALSYLGFAFSRSLWMLFASRALAGIFGGNISTAHAYIADITDEKNRSKGMGLLGAAFGLGFIFGPLLGGVLAQIGGRLGNEPPFGMSFASLGAAALCLINFTFAYSSLTESRNYSKQTQRASTSEKVLESRWAQIYSYIFDKRVGPLVFVFFLSSLAMSQLEAMLFPFMFDVFSWNHDKSSYGFAYIGLMMVFTQGYLIRKMMPSYGEVKVLSFGLLVFILSLIGISISYDLFMIAVSVTLLALGNGLTRPPNVGLISLLTNPDEQGSVMGVTNSLASLGRIIGPLLGGFFYEHIGIRSPFWLAAGLTFLAWIQLQLVRNKLPVHPQKKI